MRISTDVERSALKVWTMPVRNQILFHTPKKISISMTSSYQRFHISSRPLMPDRFSEFVRPGRYSLFHLENNLPVLYTIQIQNLNHFILDSFQYHCSLSDPFMIAVLI